MIGRTDQANHLYDRKDFWAAAFSGNLPTVSFLKAQAFQDGHASNSDPLDEQDFIVRALNALQNLKEWDQTAVIITYDDSDGWYDHVMPPIVSRSANTADGLNGPGLCGGSPGSWYGGRCGYGPRLPFIVISPWAKSNYVDHTIIDHASVVRFIEDNWGLDRIGDQSFDEMAGSILNLFDFRATAPRLPKLFLDPQTGN
jgi:phospholipase C